MLKFNAFLLNELLDFVVMTVFILSQNINNALIEMIKNTLKYFQKKGQLHIATSFECGIAKKQVAVAIIMMADFPFIGPVVSEQKYSSNSLGKMLSFFNPCSLEAYRTWKSCFNNTILSTSPSVRVNRCFQQKLPDKFLRQMSHSEMKYYYLIIMIFVDKHRIHNSCLLIYPNFLLFRAMKLFHHFPWVGFDK